MNYRLLKELKQDVLAHPFIQASIGLWKETDLTIRYSPKIKIDASDYQIFGIQQLSII